MVPARKLGYSKENRDKEARLVERDNAVRKKDRMFWMHVEGTSDTGGGQRIVLY